MPGFELLRNQLPVLLPDEFLDKNRDGPGAGFAIYVQTAGGSTVLLPLVLEGAGVLSDVHFDDLDAWFDSGSDITMHYNRLTDSCSTKLLRASSYQGSPPSDALLDRVAQAAALAFREQVPWAVVFNGPRYLTVCLEGNHVTFDSSSRTSGMGHGELGVDFVHMLMLLTSYNLLCIKKRKSTKQR